MKGKSFGTNDWKEVIAALRMLKVQTGSFACLGCGYERSCGVGGCAILRAAADLLEQAGARLAPANEPLTQDDLDSMDYDKVWIDYEDGTGEWALVCNGYIYSIDTLEGAGFDFVDYMRGERLGPHGYKVYRRPPEGDADA